MNSSFSNIFTRFGSLVVIAALFTGCAALPPRTAQDDKDIKTVAIVSLLEENTPVMHVGLTVFNNDFATVDQRGALNRTAQEVLAQRLRAARPGWNVVEVKPDPALAKKLNSGSPWVSATDRVKDELQASARDTGADLVFAIIDTTMENVPGRGMGIRTVGFTRTSALTAHIHAHIKLVLLDKNAQAIRFGGGPNSSMPAADLGLNYDLSSLKDPTVEQRVAEAIRKQLATAITAAATSMGY